MAPSPLEPRTGSGEGAACAPLADPRTTLPASAPARRVSAAPAAQAAPAAPRARAGEVHALPSSWAARALPDRGEWRFEPAAIDWEARAPRGAYVRLGRPLLQLALLVGVLPLALAPFLLVALANLVAFGDPRRVFFLQPRVGHRGRVFRIYKFRTMREAPQGELSSWKNGDDRLRVTRFGRFLRNCHLDELPQLINVLRGEMSIIGPRPEMVAVEAWAAANVPGFTERLVIRPGLTGLAQITQGYTGHDVEAYARKLAINERYFGRISLAGDLKILVMTALWMLRGRGWQWNAWGSKGRPVAD